MGSVFKLLLKSGEQSSRDFSSFINGSLLFTGNNQTAFYIGGKPNNVEASCLYINTI